MPTKIPPRVVVLGASRVAAFVALARQAAVLATLLVALPFGSCSLEEPTITLPPNANQARNRSVKVDAGLCLLKKGGSVACPTDTLPADGLRTFGLRGGNGTALAAVDDDTLPTFHNNFGALAWYWHRIPVGYGCGVTMQSVFPDRTKSLGINPVGQGDYSNFNFTQLEAVIKAAREANGAILWTAAYDIGDGAATKCVYENGQQKGQPIKDPVTWAKAVRQVMHYYDRDLPAKHKTECDAITTGQPRPWYCGASIYNVEFMRDPFGAGGYTQATKAQWLTAYAEFAKELRFGPGAEFPLPGNDVALIAPSVIIRGALGVQASGITDFIDFVVASKLPLTYLSFEVEADTPVEVQAIAQAVSSYAAAKGLRYEKGFTRPDFKGPSDGTEAIPLFMTDLRMTKSNLPKSLTNDPARFSQYKGAFYAASKILVQGLVQFASITNGPRFPTIDKTANTALEVAKTALSTDNFWFNQPAAAANGALKPAAWHSFWFHENFLAGKQSVAVQHGRDASGTGGKVESNPVDGLIVLATRETCVDNLGAPIDCNPTTAGSNPAVTTGRKHMVRVLVADLNVNVDQDILEHILRVDVAHIAPEAKTVGYKWAYLDPTAASWTSPAFSEEGVLDASAGNFHLTLPVAVPSLHYFEFLY